MHYVLLSILERLYKAKLIDLYPHMNQFMAIGYCGNGIILPKQWSIKIMLSGELICSHAEFFEYLLSYPQYEDLPSIEDNFRKITDLLKKENCSPQFLFDFPSEESKWIWMAGLIDAESSLSLIKSKKNTKRGFQYIPRFSCSSTTPILLLQIMKACHPYGSLSSHHYQDKRNNFWKKTKKVHITSAGLRFILPKIMPYLIVKKRQAEILIEAMKFLTYGKKTEVHEQKLGELWLEIRRLNRRGK
jgi:hypothetical protein